VPVDILVPVIVDPPGDIVTVHVPDDGKPLRATLPVVVPHTGWVIVPITGAEGAEGGEGITTLPEFPEVQVELFSCTAKLYIAGASPAIIVLVPLPGVVMPPGYLISVHAAEGSPFSTTLPVGVTQVGTVIRPTTGGVGVTGCAIIATGPDEPEIHPIPA
jgi:hypothetical protein